MVRTVGNVNALALDIISLAIGTYGLYFTSFVQLPAHLKDAGHSQFLTNLSLGYSLIVFALGALAHITRSSQIFRLKNSIHPIALALECVVAIVYWPLRIFFLHLLAKDPTKWAFPISIDLLVHLMPVLSLAIDYFAFMPAWTIKKTSAFAVCTLLTSFYWFWLHHLINFETGGGYPYLFLEVEGTVQRVAIFGVVGLTGFCLFLGLNTLYGVLVGKESLE